MPSSRTGIDFVNRASREQIKRNEHFLQGSGVALGDVDGDGRPDVYLPRLDGPNELYLNRGNWEFEEVASERGVSAPDRASTGALLADLDGDGDLDLVLTALGGPNSLFFNDGSGTFTERGAAAGLERKGRGSMTPAAAPVDADGDLDLHISNYKDRSVRDVLPPWERTFNAITRRTEDGFELAPGMEEHYRLEEVPERGFTARMERAEPNSLYLNRGDGSFERVSWTGGRFEDEEGRPLSSAPDYFTLTARFYDVDGDGDQDLYECNDFEDPDFFWLNEGDGHFRQVSRVAVRATSNACMAVDFADIERDGDVDFFSIDMKSDDPYRRGTLQPSHTALPKLPGRIRNRPQKQRNTLFVNRGDGTYAQIAEYAGVEASEWSWSTAFLDVDLDGYEDLLVTNGILLDVQKLDASQTIRSRVKSNFRRRGTFDWREMRFLYPEGHTRNVAFRNRGDRTFERMGQAWEWSTGKDVSHGFASADLDGDGDQDVVVNRMRSEALVLRNEAAAPRIQVQLAGEGDNSRGIGATVRVEGGPVPVQSRQMTAGGLYLSSSAPELTFAAGRPTEPSEPADSLRIVVRWPDGDRSVIEEAEPDRLYEIRESGAAAVDGSRDEAEGDSSTTPDSTLFREVSEQLSHEHADTLFEDDERQPLIPNRLSQPGPGVSWRDVDGNGAPDLLISSGRGGRLAHYRNKEGEFRRVATGLGEAEHDQTTVLAVPGEGEGGTRLLVGQSGYERTPDRAARVPQVLAVDAAGKQIGTDADVDTVAPGRRSAAGPLALADVDGDGDLDLFVGGRVVPAAYPAPASSRLFLNERDGWVRDSANSSRFEDVGLVSGAVFSDVDADGDPDLVLATEWGPVKLFENEGGALREATREWGLAERTSRWRGISAGDLNGDGRMDLVVTSWGRNTPYRPVSEERPLHVYYGDFNRDGQVNVVEARRGTRDGRRGLFPVDHPLQLEEAFPQPKRRFEGYSEFAGATVEEVIGRPPEEVSHRRIVTMDHTLFLNRGGRFEPSPLPPMAQLAPASYVGVADFDGDGHEDVFLSQNFFPTADETPRYDAGRGLLLLGDGEGGLEPVPGHESGIEVYGDQRGAAFADYDGDGRLDLVVSQNAAETVLYRNRGARLGLRVRLDGPAGNPRGVGAQIRLVYPGGPGPAREVHAGSGYWSVDGAVQVMGAADSARAVRVRWPGGVVTTDSIPAGASGITVTRGGVR